MVTPLKEGWSSSAERSNDAAHHRPEIKLASQQTKMRCPSPELDLFDTPIDEMQLQNNVQIDHASAIQATASLGDVCLSNPRIDTVTATNGIDMLMGKSDGQCAPTHIFGFAQEPMIMATDEDTGRVDSPSSDVKQQSGSLEDWSCSQDEIIPSNASPAVSSEAFDALANATGADGRALDIWISDHVYNQSFTDDAYEKTAHRKESSSAVGLDVGGTNDFFAMPMTAEKDVPVNSLHVDEDIDNTLFGSTIVDATEDDLNLFGHEAINIDELFCHRPKNNVPDPDSTTENGQRSMVIENKKRTYSHRKRLRQSKVVMKCIWGTNPELSHRHEHSGGIYINGTWTPVYGSEKDAPQTQQRNKNKPSRFCHICLRRAERVTAVACAKLMTTRCRKIICSRCFDEYGWDWRVATMGGSQWECAHCQQM